MGCREIGTPFLSLGAKAMKSNLINNYRMGGYLLVAIGLINLRYQSGQGGVLAHSVTIIIPGAVLLLSTLVPSMMKVLSTRVSQVLALTFGALLIAYAVIN